MLLRCERCRAVYRLESSAPTADGSVVAISDARPEFAQCGRCHHVFRVEGEPVALDPVGKLGGAATRGPRVPTPPKPIAAVPHVERPPPSMLPVWIAAIAVVAGLLWGEGRSYHLAKARAARMEALTADGAELLRRDDELSLSTAMHRFADASLIAPSNMDVRANEGLALLLLGKSLRDDADDLFSEIARESASPAESLTEASRAHLAELKRRLPETNTRADEAIRDGLKLAKEVEQRSGLRDLETSRVIWIADALQHHMEPLLKAPVANTREEEQALASWWHLGRAFAVELSDHLEPQLGSLEDELSSALEADPGNLRARWELARFYSSRIPPDARAGTLLTGILSANPQHDGALRLAGIQHAAPGKTN